MENATKAMIMAASVLLGVMIISLGTVLFTSFANYSADVQEDLAMNALQEFNTQFIKYYNGSTGEKGDKEPILVTAHELVSLANLAKESNIANEIAEETSYSALTQYIQIDILQITGLRNFEKKSSQEYHTFLAQNDIIYLDDGTSKPKYFFCTQVEYNTFGQVNYMCFQPYEN